MAGSWSDTKQKAAGSYVEANGGSECCSGPISPTLSSMNASLCSPRLTAWWEGSLRSPGVSAQVEQTMVRGPAHGVNQLRKGGAYVGVSFGLGPSAQMWGSSSQPRVWGKRGIGPLSAERPGQPSTLPLSSILPPLTSPCGSDSPELSCRGRSQSRQRSPTGQDPHSRASFPRQEPKQKCLGDVPPSSVWDCLTEPGSPAGWRL